jgi:dTDP-4-amino-4,6-dideoxygalactose transaminase
MYCFGEEEIAAALAVLGSGKLFRYMNEDSSQVSSFERRFAERLRCQYSILTSSGTAALVCALAAIGIGPGDEVAIPSYTFIATALAPLALGALPIICDIDETLTIDVSDLARRISPRTRAIVPVHMNGRACDMLGLMTFAERRGLLVVEDACQALGGRYRGRLLGTFGALGAFSFNQFKVITAGGGGAIVTNQRVLYERAFMQHDGACMLSHHASRFTEPAFAGLSFRANEITGAILLAQLIKLDKILEGLRAGKRKMLEAISRATKIREAPHHDIEGAYETEIAFTLPSELDAQYFKHCVIKAGLQARNAGDFGHVYTNWPALSARRGSIHPERDPLQKSQQTYEPGLCTTADRLIARTVLISVELDISDERLTHISQTLRHTC